MYEDHSGGHMTCGFCTGLQWGHLNSIDLHIFFLYSECY